MIIVAIVFFGIYGVFVSILFFGLRGRTGLPRNPTQSHITVIVPVRNEGSNIRQLLQDLKFQRYENFDVIVVDDHSDDNTVPVVKELTDKKIAVIPNSGVGKKLAITSGVNAAKGEIIATTDGDCRVSENWLASVNDCFRLQQIDMAVGPVVINEGKKVFSKMQQLEFASLIGASASTLQLGFPTMCNGANLAYRKSTFLRVAGYEDNLHIASGDDEFLMRKIFAFNSKGVIYNFGPVVRTHPQPSLTSFVQQRLRWAGKWKFNSSLATQGLAVFILTIQLISIYGFYRIVLGDPIFIGVLIFKILLEFLVLKRFTSFLCIRLHGLSFFLLQLCYPFYVTFIGIISLFRSYSWKGRKYD